MDAHYTRLFADDEGHSCLEHVAIPLAQAFSVEGIESVPTAPFLGCEGTFWVGSTTAWKGEALHPAPRRFLLIEVTGEYAVTTSRGVTRRSHRAACCSFKTRRAGGIRRGRLAMGWRFVWPYRRRREAARKFVRMSRILAAEIYDRDTRAWPTRSSSSGDAG